MSSHALVVIAKRPAPGKTKTRLSPPLSCRQASGLYECFLRDTLEMVRAVPQVTRLISYAPPEELGYFRRLAPDFDLLPQMGTDLGARLDNALTCCLRNGFDRAVIVDSDSPTLPATYLARAFDLLDGTDVVLGPCDDGGYYLIGLREPQPRLLLEVRMSTPEVLRNTIALAGRAGLRVALLPPCYDVDTVADLERLGRELKVAPEEIAPNTRAFLRKLRLERQSESGTGL